MSIKEELSTSEIQDALESLFQICAEQNVKVPENIMTTLRTIQNDEKGFEIVLKSDEKDASRVPQKEELSRKRSQILKELESNPMVQEFAEVNQQFKMAMPIPGIRIKNACFHVTEYFAQDDGDTNNQDKTRKKKKENITTVLNSTPAFQLVSKIRRVMKTGKLCERVQGEDKVIIDGINLVFHPGKMYLVLGGPGSGKSSLLKLIAGTLSETKHTKVTGSVTSGSLTRDSEGVVWSNIVGYIDQIDRLHPRLTVKETLEFAWRCRHGSTHDSPFYDREAKMALTSQLEKWDKELYLVNRIMDGIGLKRVADTFVGDQQAVRGVSGGERKRVTVGEMAVGQFPVLCADEISTGLDAATTFDIIQLIAAVNRIVGGTKIITLLQPPPETLSLFDGVILLSEGKVVYSGPVGEVVPHFESLGYQVPERMDVADWLQALPTKDGSKFLVDKANGAHLTTDEFREKFYSCELGRSILQELDSPPGELKNLTDEAKVWMSKRYKNNWMGSLQLLTKRELLLWWRDKEQIKVRVAQDVIMGTIAGTLFWQASDNPQSVMGILFQSMFFICLGGMLKAMPLFAARGIFYKHQDANFFPTWSYVVARSIAGVPASIIDTLVYGSIAFWFVGLAYSDGATIANYFMFLALVLSASTATGFMFSIFSTVVRDQTMGQGAMAVILIIFVLFSGYTVQPDVIPVYWIWVYYINPFAWALRGLAVNEYDSGKYDKSSGIGDFTQGEVALIRFGFVDSEDDALGFEWAIWAIIYMAFVAVMAVILSTYFLRSIRFASGKSLGGGNDEDKDERVDDYGEVENEPQMVDLPFQKVDLTFKDIHYEVTTSVGKEKLELLKGIDGVIESGKMTALMGSSGAGKTTLMDVLALRKSSGEITGEVRLNGHLQEQQTFRRCMGYVEQFDVQSAQLTIRETCEFSAKLRLEQSDPAVTPESTAKFVDQTLAMLELTSIQDKLVGSDGSGGLSFEQRKRLSIAVELVANPSIIFLDEPTSGLDARAAAIVMRGLKRIALSGRTVCATIHQPSIAIFNSFDALLLLKRGGETVFFGDLGHESANLIQYFERYKDTPCIQPGVNPATWMLNVIGAGSGSSDKKPFDYAGHYKASKLHKDVLVRIKEIEESASDEGQVVFPSTYATTALTQMRLSINRIRTIFWRSPSYNIGRVITSAIVALLFGSVYVSSRSPSNESDMNSRATTMFIAFIFLSVNAHNMALGVFEAERNMFYRHKAALMYDKLALLAGFAFAEIPFILWSSMTFVVIFYFMIGFAAEASKFFLFYLYFTMSLAFFTFLAHMLVSLNRDAKTAQGFGMLVIATSVLFTGVLIRPENIPTFWSFMYWVAPSHYVYEGLIVSQFQNDDTPIVATPGTPFWKYLHCVPSDTMVPCVGTAEEWVFASFGGNFIEDHLLWNFFYLIALIIVTRIVTAIALAKLNYRST